MGCALTEPDAGPDLAAAATTAVRDGDELVINGPACFVLTDPDNPSGHMRHSIVIVEMDRSRFKFMHLISQDKIRGILFAARIESPIFTQKILFLPLSFINVNNIKIDTNQGS